MAAVPMIAAGLRAVVVARLAALVGAAFAVIGLSVALVSSAFAYGQVSMDTPGTTQVARLFGQYVDSAGADPCAAPYNCVSGGPYATVEEWNAAAIASYAPTSGNVCVTFTTGVYFASTGTQVGLTSMPAVGTGGALRLRRNGYMAGNTTSVVTCGDSFFFYNRRLVTEATGGCPANSTSLNGTCICNGGYKPNGDATACVALECLATLSAIQGYSLSWSGNSSATCYQGCQFTATVRGYQSSTNTSSTDAVALQATGTCAIGSADPATGTTAGTTAGGQCPVGQCPGTVNGQSVCVTCSTTAQDAETVSTGASGASTGSSSSETTCNGATCTTTTTTKDSTGTPTGTQATTVPQTQFCASNPGSPLCAAKSFGGTCAATTCAGDAIQCAIAQEQAKRACEFFGDNGAVTAEGTAAATAGARPPDHPGESAATVSLAGGFDQTALIAASCPADITVPMGGGRPPLVLKVSEICGPAAVLGNVLVGLTALACLGIVFLRGS